MNFHYTTPGEITAAYASLKDSDQHTVRVLATQIAGAIITGELPLSGGNLLLTLLGRSRVEMPKSETNPAAAPARLAGHYCPDWDRAWIEPGTPEWDVCICDGK